jgi:hypothetical protein
LQVLPNPDCMVAVVLMEQTLAHRFAEMYTGVGLPPLELLLGSDEAAGGVDGGSGVAGRAAGIDEVLGTMYGMLARYLAGC